MLKIFSPKYVWIYSVIAILAIFFRIAVPGNYPFGFDQVQILENSTTISQGDLVLLGPRTGPASMFTGPLIYYLAAIFQFFTHTPYIVVFTAILISISTGLITFWLTNRYLEKKTALVFFFLWAVSPLMVTFDRIPWNPSLTFLGAALAFLPFFAKKHGWLDISLIAIGVFLGYQAHFTTLFLLPLVCLSTIMVVSSNKNKVLIIGASTIAFFSSLLPTIVFDYRHQWLNYQGFLAMLGKKGSETDPSYLEKLFHQALIVVETLGKVLIVEAPFLLYLVIGAAFLFFYGQNTWKNNLDKSLKLPILWIVFVVVIFSFYNGQTPEYYFFILLPALFFVVSKVLVQLNYKVLSILSIFFITYVSLSFFNTVLSQSGFRLGTQIKTAEYLEKLQNSESIAHIYYDMPEIETVGIKYLLNQKNITETSSGIVLHLEYPFKDTVFEHRLFSEDVAVWQDTRTSDKNYITNAKYLLSMPNEYRAYQSFETEDLGSATVSYVIFQENTKVGLIQIYDKLYSVSAFNGIKTNSRATPEIVEQTSSWRPLDSNSSFFENAQYGVVLTNLEATSLESIILVKL